MAVTRTSENVALITGDIEIGAVELKDGTTDARGTVNAANTARTTATTTVVVQTVDEAGLVLGRDAVNTARTTSTKAAPSINVRADGSVDGTPVRISAAFTRPNDTNTYAAGDVVSDSTSAPTVMTFTGAARAAAKPGTIVSALLFDSANVAVKGSFELWLFDVTVTPDNDNAVFTPTDAEMLTLVRVIPFTLSYVGDATSGAGGNATYVGTLSEPINFNSASGNLFGVLVVRNAYIPVGQEIFTVQLLIEQR